MSDEPYIYATAAVIVATVLLGVFRKSFDPFAPIWLFLVGYAQVYVVQAISYRDWAIRVRGHELVDRGERAGLLGACSGSWRSITAGSARSSPARLPRPPASGRRRWSPSITPLMIVWGLVCAGLVLGGGDDEPDVAPRRRLLRAFPIMMLVGGHPADRDRPAAGDGRGRCSPGPGVVVVVGLHRDLDVQRQAVALAVRRADDASARSTLARASGRRCPCWRRRRWPACLVVSLAIGWRGNNRTTSTTSRASSQYVGDFDLESILVNLNIKSQHDEEIDVRRRDGQPRDRGVRRLPPDDGHRARRSRTTTTAPRTSGSSRPTSPGSSGTTSRSTAASSGSTPGSPARSSSATTTSPARRSASWAPPSSTAAPSATLIVMAVLAPAAPHGLRVLPAPRRVPWVQVWWSLTFYNAWLMIVNDDPFVWFYYIYGHTTVPPRGLPLVRSPANEASEHSLERRRLAGRCRYTFAPIAAGESAAVPGSRVIA